MDIVQRAVIQDLHVSVNRIHNFIITGASRAFCDSADRPLITFL